MSLKKCPICNIELFMAERQGVEIDYCKKCGGVWLDKDELEAIINISDQFMNEKSFSDEDIAGLPAGEAESFLSGFFDFNEEEEA